MPRALPMTSRHRPKRSAGSKAKQALMMELPSYHWPNLRNLAVVVALTLLGAWVLHRTVEEPWVDLGALQAGRGPERVVVRRPADDILHAGFDLVEHQPRRPARGVAASGDHARRHGQRQAGTTEPEIEGVAGDLGDLHGHPSSSTVLRAAPRVSATSPSRAVPSSSTSPVRNTLA